MFVRITRADPHTWEATLDKHTWEDASVSMLAMRAPCPLPGYETRRATILPNRKGGRRCQLRVRFVLYNSAARIDSAAAVEGLLSPWSHYRETD